MAKKKKSSVLSRDIHLGIVLITLLLIGLIFMIFVTLTVKAADVENKTEFKVITYPSEAPVVDKSK